MVFRTTPQLGPQLEDAFVGLPYWDLSGIQGTGEATVAGVTEPSYRLGNRESGSDGHVYIWVQAGAELEAEDTIGVNETTWVTTTGTALAVPAGVVGTIPEGAYFHARVVAL